MPVNNIHTLFLDIGGVLLTNGWDTPARQKAIHAFALDEKDFEKRHAMAFDIYERGRVTLDAYLDLLVFYTDRSFSRQDFKDFIFSQSQELPGALDFFHEVKAKNRIPIAALNNEPRELNAYRIKKFELDSLFDYFVSSCYIDRRKPEAQMYSMACDIAAVQPAEALYIDDREHYLPVATALGLQCIHYTGIEAARDELKKHGFNI